MNIQEFIEENGITMTLKRAPNNPAMAIMNTTPMNHWKVTLHHRNGNRMELFFSQGLGIKHDPKIEGVLDCLASDAAGIEGATFESWADEYGYDSDSRKAERLFNACRDQAFMLQNFLGFDAYELLICDIERL